VYPILPLDEMKSGETGRVADLDGPDDWVHRLAELGFRTGVTVKMVKPGAPCILELNQQRMTCRLDRKATVLVELLPPQDSKEPTRGR
jgi:Fe2+ transport system protein FeoA